MADVWYDHDRSIRVRVLAGPMLQDITRAVTGDISIQRQAGNPVVTCSIPVASPYLPLFVDGSWSKVPFPVEIWVQGWSNDSATDVARIFKGKTEIPDNSGNVLPIGTLKAVSDSADWANRSGCLVMNGFAGNTRIEVLEDFASNGGFTFTLSSPVPTSSQVNKPVDMQSVTLLSLLERFGLVDGWQARENDGECLLIPFADIAGPTATAVHDYTPANYFSISERPPNRPVTLYVVTGSKAYLAEDTTVTVTDGDYSNSQETVDGALANELTELTGDYTPIGVNVESPITGVYKSTEVQYVWNTNGNGEPNGRPASKTTIKKGYYCPYSYQTGTVDDVTFTDGSYRYIGNGWPSDHEEFVEIAKEVITYTWDADFCFLKERTVERWAWSKRPKYAADSGTAYTWPDGTDYLDPYEVYDQVEAFKEAYSYYQPSMGTAEHDSLGLKGGINQREVKQVTATITKEARAYPLEIDEVYTTWKVENADATAHQIFYKDYSRGIPIWTGTLYAGYQGQSKNEQWQEDASGPIPLPPKRSAAQRIFSSEKMRVYYEIPSDYPEVVEAYDNEDAESIEELVRAISWKARNSFADQITLSVPGDPALKELDCVTVTDPVRNLDEAKGWIDSITYTLNPANGKFMANVIVKVDLMSATAP